MFACELSELPVGPPGGSSVRPAKSTSSLHQSASADRFGGLRQASAATGRSGSNPQTGRTTRLRAEPDVCQASRKAKAAMVVTMHRLSVARSRRLRRSARMLRRARAENRGERFRVAFSTTATVAGKPPPPPHEPQKRAALAMRGAGRRRSRGPSHQASRLALSTKTRESAAPQPVPGRSTSR